MMSRTVGWLTLFLIGTDLFVMSPLLPAITRGFGVSVSASGWAVTVFAVAYLVGGPSFGALADRSSRHTILAIGLIVFAIANLGTAVAPSLALLLVARAVAGLAASGITPSVYALVSATAPSAERATWLAVVTSGLLIALTTGAPAGSLLATAVGWQGVFVILTVASLVMLGVNRWSVTRARRKPAAASDPRPDNAQRPDLATGSTPRPERRSDAPPAERPPSTVTRVRAVAVTALWALAVYGLYTYLGTILLRTAHFSPDLVAAALACFGVGAVAGNLVGGRVADRYGGRNTSIVSLLALAAAEAGFGLVLHAATGVLLIMLTITALAAYPYFTAQQVRLVARHPGVSGSLIAWNNSAMYAGILVGSGVGGVVLTSFGAPILAYATATIAVLGALAATRSITSPPDPDRPPRRPEVGADGKPVLHGG